MQQILLIDDKIIISQGIKEKLDLVISKNQQSNYSVVIWDEKILKEKYDANFFQDETVSNADEDVWARALKRENNISCVVIDHDLSNLGSIRISESVMANACKKESIPICTYHRQPTPSTESQNLRNSVNQSRSFSIEIDINDLDNASNEIINVANGFNFLKDTINLKDFSELNKGPAFTIASILQKPDLESFFSRYTSSSTLASDIIKHDKDYENHEYLKIKIPFILGCWLYNYILPFPGIILNSTAAASYINLEVNNFLEYQNYFIDAKYNGPFSENKTYWWRYDLDRILIQNECEDGVEFLEKNQIQNISACKCTVSQEAPAGFYCLVREAPISLEASVGNLSWVAEGADLCRINKQIYNRLAPMMGL